jgi:hypothetical protein
MYGTLPREGVTVDASVAPDTVAQDETVTEWSYNGRRVEVGTELSIEGERGRFLFRQYVRKGGKEWIDVFGGVSGHEKPRSFRPNRVKTVHRIQKTRSNAA